MGVPYTRTVSRQSTYKFLYLFSMKMWS